MPQLITAIGHSGTFRFRTANKAHTQSLCTLSFGQEKSSASRALEHAQTTTTVNGFYIVSMLYGQNVVRSFPPPNEARKNRLHHGPF